MNGRSDFQSRRSPQVRSQSSRPQPPTHRPAPAPSLPEGYLKRGYFDAEGNLWPEVVIDWPMDLAGKLKQASMSSSQFRRFFNRARFLEDRYRSHAIGFGRVKEELRILQSLAAASVGRKNAPPLFLEMFETNVNVTVASSTEEAFCRGFMTHMQSVVAYLKYNERA